MNKILISTLLHIVIACSDLFSQQDVNGWFWLNGQPTGNNMIWSYLTPAGNQYVIGGRGTFATSTNGGSQWSINSQVGIYDAALLYKDLRAGFFVDGNTGYVAGGIFGFGFYKLYLILGKKYNFTTKYD